MAALESYSPCPCGSGQKYKWCCQKAEPYAAKSARLQETGAIEPAKAALDEGLAKFPDNPWLAIRKAVLLARQEKTAEAAEILKRLIAKEPGHPGAYNFLVRAVVETEGVAAGVARLQDALASVAPEHRMALASTAEVVAVVLLEQGHIPASLAHFELESRLDPEADEATPMAGRSQRLVEANARVSPWLRNPYHFSPAPTALPDDKLVAFEEASKLANDGLWSKAAQAFERLAAQGVVEAEKNAGLCHLDLAEDDLAVAAIRRYIAQRGDAIEAVDLEGLCQILAPAKGGELVAHVQLIWNLRDRAGLLKKLGEDSRVAAEGPGPIDEADPNSPVVEWFALLDRPKPTSVAGVPAKDLPRVEARVTVGTEIAALDVVDDGRLERLRDRLVEVAGPTLPPAHPRTKTLGPVSKQSVALDSEIWLPEGVSPEDNARLSAEEHKRVIFEVWPDTAMPYLGHRSPRQAAEAGDAVVPLRAAILQFETGQVFFRHDLDFSGLRRELNLPDEPEIDPATVDVETLHLSRLDRVPADRLDDERLLALFERAQRYLLPQALENAAKAIVERPSIAHREDFDSFAAYADLANLAMSRKAPKDEIFGWVTRGRQADRTKQSPVRWDFLELRLRSRSEKPEEWVPQLAILLERYAEDRTASQWVMSNLMDMGLVQMVPNPDDPQQMLLDTRRLQAVLSQFGPKITTASGRLGVSATQGGIWTPGGETSGSTGGGKIWTPGSGSSSGETGGGKSNLIIPGR